MLQHQTQPKNIKITQIGYKLQGCINLPYKTKTNKHIAQKKGIHRGTGCQWKSKDYVWDLLKPYSDPDGSEPAC